MAVFHPHTVKCSCGNLLTVELADSLNVKRFPDARSRILRGELHRAACAACGKTMTVEKPFYYLDPDRGALFRVAPRQERHRWKEASTKLDAASSLVPDAITNGSRSLRVVFGMDELREKLLAQDAGLDDRVLELLKVMLIADHPILLRRARLRLVLDDLSDDGLSFVASYEHHPRRFQLVLPAAIVERVKNEPQMLERWVRSAHRHENVFELPDHWVNIWRWSPQPTDLDRLRQFAGDLEAGKEIDVHSQPFRNMLTGLPHGSHLPAWAKQDLRTLYEYAKRKGIAALEDQLFEIRFGIELEDDWSTNSDRDDIDTLWMLLKDLPDSNVEGNTHIRELLLEVGEGGGWYDPSTNDIAIGSDELANLERFEDVVRHEVGHAVHENRSVLVDGWLWDEFGWRLFGVGDADVDAWVALMGGWGTLTSAEQRDVRHALKTALGPGSSWKPGPTPYLPPGHAWHRSNFGPRIAFEKTGSHWFRNFRNWYRANGNAFFLNYWYRTLVVVRESTLQLVERMPDDYAAMSPYEFFAELYAVRFDPDEDLSAIPARVLDWIDTNIGAPEPGAPSRPRPSVREEWETITRPAARPFTRVA
jgi:hypothetical protein